MLPSPGWRTGLPLSTEAKGEAMMAELSDSDGARASGGGEMQTIWVPLDDSRAATEDGTGRRWGLYYVDVWGRVRSSGLSAGYEAGQKVEVAR